jgi:hypothetical protein
MGQDEELTPKARRTVTRSASPTPTPSPGPATVPVGQGAVSPADVVWAQGNVLHVGKRAVDLLTVGVDALVVVRGGVFVLSTVGEVWFTDLARLRGTRLARVTGLGATADRSHLVLTRKDGDRTTTYAYDARTGRAVDPESVQPASAEELLGDVQGVQVTRARFRGAVPEVFEPVGRPSPSRVYGLAGGSSAPTAVTTCHLTRRTCARLGGVDPADPVVFGSGKQPDE